MCSPQLPHPAKCGLDPVSLPRLGSKKGVASVLGALSRSHSLALREASCSVASCPRERPTWQRTDIAGQQPRRPRGLATATPVSMGAGPPHLEP